MFVPKEELILARLAEVWKRRPHLTLAQLIGNVFYGSLYDQSDEEVLAALEKHYSCVRARKREE